VGSHSFVIEKVRKKAFPTSSAFGLRGTEKLEFMFYRRSCCMSNCQYLIYFLPVLCGGLHFRLLL